MDYYGDVYSSPVMTDKTTSANLTDAELILLDGRCSAEVQVQVNAAKARAEAVATRSHLPAHIARLVADVVSEATTNGLVSYGPVRIRGCDYCGAKPDPLYVRYKSGPRRGRSNYDKPRYLSGVEYAQRFVRMEGYPTLGACSDCEAAASGELVDALAGVHAQIPARLAAAGRPVWVRYDRRHCKRCDWSGHAGQMVHERALMGDGWYPARCPDCGAGGAFDRTVETVDGYVVTDDPITKG